MPRIPESEIERKRGSGDIKQQLTWKEMADSAGGMARSIRIEYPGAFYHVMARGNRREAIFKDDDDRRFFLKTLSEACAMTGWRVHAWVLMGNHYHLLVETPEANLVDGMKWLQNTYTRRFNVRHGLWGRLFGDRYKSVLVEGEGHYYETLVNYIHLNPARAHLVNPEKGGGILDYAQRLLKQGLEAAGLVKSDLAKLPGSDLRKVAIARQIWDRTTVSMNWVSEQLAMKSAANASTQIRYMKKMKQPTKSLPAALCSWISQS